MIEVHLYGKLRRFTANQDPARDSILNLPVETGDTIEDIARHGSIPIEEIGSNIFLNGQLSAPTRSVAPGDRLGVFPSDMATLYKWYFAKQE